MCAWGLRGAQCKLAKIKWSKCSSVPRVKLYASHTGVYGGWKGAPRLAFGFPPAPSSLRKPCHPSFQAAVPSAVRQLELHSVVHSCFVGRALERGFEV